MAARSQALAPAACLLFLLGCIASSAAREGVGLARPEPALRPNTVLYPFEDVPEDFSAEVYDPKGIIRTFNSYFVDDDCKDFIPNGWNAWNNPMLDQAMAAADGDEVSGAFLNSLFYGAHSYGFNLMRLFGFGVQNKTILQTSPGEYDEEIWAGFDYILDLASKYDIKIIWAFTSHWQQSDAPAAYLGWCEKCTGPNGQCSLEDLDKFWTDACTTVLFKKHIKNVVERKNSINGRVYKNDPTIFAWNLYNEPRCPANQTQDYSAFCLPAIQKWTEDVASWVKIVDPNHMLTWGHEGFFRSDSPYVENNPYGTPKNVQPGWSGYVGQDFEAQQGKDMPYIDFMAIHMWPDNWASADPEKLDWIDQWLQSHLEVAREANKPLIMEEFGKRALAHETSYVRDPIFQRVYDAVQLSLENDDALRGDLFWNWDPFDYQKVQAIYGANGLLPPAANAVKNNHSTFQVIRDHAQAVLKYNGKNRKSEGCIVRTSSQP